jgi:hypothetical protein
LEGKTAEEIELIRLTLKNELAAIEASREDELAQSLKDVEDQEKDSFERRVSNTKDFVDNTGKVFETLSKAKLDGINADLAENSKALEEQQRLNAAGFDSELGFRQKRQAELELQAQQEAERMADIQKLVAYFNLLAEYAKDDPDLAAIKAASQIAIAETFVGFYAEGTEYVGGDNATKWRSTGTDDYLAAVDEGERIISADLNAKIGNMTNADLAGLAYDYQRGFSASAVSTTAVVDPTPLYEAAAHLKKEFRDLRIYVGIDRYGKQMQQNVIGKIKDTVKSQRNLPN